MVEDEIALISKDEKELEYLQQQNMQIPSIQLFMELGKLFDKELRHTVA